MNAVPRQKLVVVGNGMAGMRTVEELLALAPARFEITVFGAEPHPNYNRIMLSSVLAGEKAVDDIVINPRAWYADNGVTLHTGDPVLAIDPAAKTVTAASGLVVPYDRLLLSTGSKLLMPPLPGLDLPGVVAFRDIADVEKMLAAAEAGRVELSRCILPSGAVIRHLASGGAQLLLPDGNVAERAEGADPASKTPSLPWMLLPAHAEHTFGMFPAGVAPGYCRWFCMSANINVRLASPG